MSIDFQTDIVDQLYNTIVADAKYQSPGVFGLPENFGDLQLSSFEIENTGAGYQVNETLLLDGGIYNEAGTLTITEIDEPFNLVGAAIDDPGTGYTQDNVLTLVGGTFDTAATITVDEVDGSGVVVAYSISEPGSYTTIPTNPVAVTGGAGTGFTTITSWGGTVTTLEISDAGSYQSVPTGTITTTSSGGGTGVTGTALWSGSGEQRILVLVAVLSAFLTTLTDTHEAKLADKLIRRMTACMKFRSGGDFDQIAIKAETEALTFLGGQNYTRLM